jgi:ferredoxin
LNQIGKYKMTYVVTENCIKCKYTDCVEVCPVDCFYEGSNFLAINPDECIDCGVCVAECPVDAIVSDRDLTEEQKPYLALNAELSAIWPVITKRKEPSPDADTFKNVKNKGNMLER